MLLFTTGNLNAWCKSMHFDPNFHSGSSLFGRESFKTTLSHDVYNGESLLLLATKQSTLCCKCCDNCLFGRFCSTWITSFFETSGVTAAFHKQPFCDNLIVIVYKEVSAETRWPWRTDGCNCHHMNANPWITRLQMIDHMRAWVDGNLIVPTQKPFPRRSKKKTNHDGMNEKPWTEYNLLSPHKTIAHAARCVVTVWELCRCWNEKRKNKSKWHQH